MPVLISTSMAAFRSTCAAALDRFPYYAGDDADDAPAVARADLEAIIKEIDPDVLRVDSFWVTFLDDVEMGDFTTEAVERLIAEVSR